MNCQYCGYINMFSMSSNYRCLSCGRDLLSGVWLTPEIPSLHEQKEQDNKEESDE